MLNLVPPLQTPIQAKQPTNFTRQKESGGEQFNKILARETAEKESPPPTTENAAKEANGKISETPEATPKTVENANAADTNGTNRAIGSPNSAFQHTSSETQQHLTDQTIQIAFMEDNADFEVISPFQPAVILTPPLNQPNINANKPGLGQNLNSTSSLLSSLSGSQQGMRRDLLGGDSVWQSAQTANSADDGKILSFSTFASKDILTRLGEPGALSQIDSDTLQQPSSNSHAQIFSQSSPQAAASHSLNLDTQIGQPKWNGEFAQKIVWLANQQHQVAELRLNPAHLGPVEIMLSLTSENGTQASAQFVSPHLAVREAIEAALPRLRELMAESGIQLGDVMVGAESFQRQEQGGQRTHYSAGNAHGFGSNDEPDAHQEKQIVSNGHNGLVNTFA